MLLTKRLHWTAFWKQSMARSACGSSSLMPVVTIPFSVSMKRHVATRSASRGLAKVEPQTSDTLIAYAARAGSTAEDGKGEHSPMTTALLHNLTVPGLDIRLAFGLIRDEVVKITNNRQEPFVYGSLGGGIISLVPQPSQPISPDPIAGPSAGPRHPRSVPLRR